MGWCCRPASCAGGGASSSRRLPTSSISKISDGDGKADRREVLVTGFAVTNPQHRVNTPVYGLDNWIYFAHEGPAEAVIYTDMFGDLGRALT